MELSDVRDEDAAIEWQLRLEQWWQSFGHLTKERTLLKNGRFGFTHDRLRKAWQLIRLVVRRNLLFTHITYGNPRTTSRLEGLNAQIRNLLHRHRGMTEEHHRRAVEWFLTTHERTITEAIKTTSPVPKTTAEQQPDDQVSRVVYDTALTAEEGLWARSGHIH